MNPKEVLKRLVDDLDDDTALRILQDWDDIVDSYKRSAVIFFDGSARPNPGSMKIGAVVKCCGSVYEISKNVGKGTNNMAEYLALIEALKAARKMGAKSVKIYGDSSIVIEQINGNWKVKSEELKNLKREVMDLLGKFKRWKAEWIPDSKNKRAHDLANS